MNKHDEIFQKAREDYAEALTADIERQASDKQREWNRRGGEPRMLIWKNRIKRSLGR